MCSIILTPKNSNEYDILHSKYICLDCLKIKNQTRYALKKEKIRERQKGYEINNKQKVIDNYGGKCNCCGENVFEFLTIDHINNDGAELRDTQGTGGKLYRWLISNNYPKDNYQLLCFNCNCSKGFYGKCPHSK